MKVGELETHKFYSNEYTISGNHKIHDTIAYLHPVNYAMMGMYHNIVDADKDKVYKLYDKTGMAYASSYMTTYESRHGDIDFAYCDPFIALDPNIAEAISILNRKCYYTKYCCEGHASHKESAYIAFDKNRQIDHRLVERLVYDLPITWYLDEYSNNILQDMIVIRSDYINHDEAMIDILDWANSLPDIGKGISLKILGGNQ